jgi:hypothetical protein
LASSRDAVRSVFNDEKQLSIAALSQTLPERLSNRRRRDRNQPLELLTGVLATAIGMMQ